MVNKLTKTSKALLVLLVTLAMAFSAIGMAGLFNNSTKVLAEESASEWMTGSPSTYNENTQLFSIAGSAILANKVDILSLPNKTATFSMRMKKGTGWSGIAFLEALQTETQSWDQVQWPGSNIPGLDTLPHVIIQDEKAQLYGNSTAELFGAPSVGVSGMPANTFNYLTSVEIHIGTGEGEDFSYIKIGGSMLLKESTTDSVLKFLTVDSFASGECYIGMHINFDALSECVADFSNYSTPVVSAIDEKLRSTIDVLDQAAIPDTISFTASNLADNADLAVELNGTALATTDYSINTDTAGQAVVTLNKSLFTIEKLQKKNALTVTSTNGCAVVLFDAKIALPPVLADGDAYQEMSAVADVEFVIEYINGDPITASDIAITSGVYFGMIDATPLTLETDYTFEDLGDETYKITILQSYLADKFDTYNGRLFVINVLDESLSANIFVQEDVEEWAFRSVDIVEDSTVATDDYYTTATMAMVNPPSLATRTYYTKGISVTEPIVLEFEAIQANSEWVMLEVNDSLKNMDFFSDGTKGDTFLQTLFFGGRNDVQKFAGYVETASTNATYNTSKMKNTVVEIYFGTVAGEGYVKINDSLVGEPLKLQADFSNGLAYVGFFFNNNKQAENKFVVNSHINPVAIASPTAESAYAMDLADASDMQLKLLNASNTLVLTNEAGYTLVENTDYTIDVATGALTLTKAYFESLKFTKLGTISIFDTATQKGTKFNMNYSTSAMLDSKISFATVGEIDDVEFDLAGYTEISSIMLKDGSNLSTDLYTFENSILTISKDAIVDAVGNVEFLVVLGKELMPVYVVVNEFEAGGVITNGEGSVTTGNGAIITENGLSYTLEQSFNFEKGFTVKVDFKEIPGYYKGGLNYKDIGFIKLNFYDVYSGLTLTYVLYANYADDEVTATNTALYEEYFVTDAEGNVVVLKNVRAINIANSENPSALGAHVIKFEATDGKVQVTVDNSRKVTLANLGLFSLTGSLMTFEVPNNVADKNMSVGLIVYPIDVTVDYSDVTTEKEPGSSEPDSDSTSTSTSESELESVSGGCGSAMESGIIAILLGAFIVIFARKKAIKN